MHNKDWRISAAIFPGISVLIMLITLVSCSYSSDNESTSQLKTKTTTSKFFEGDCMFGSRGVNSNETYTRYTSDRGYKVKWDDE